jgi:transcriptional regulator with XRE-family HTH domain
VTTILPDHQFYADLAVRLKRLRQQAGLTQQEVAERLGIDPQAVYRWEAGKRRPRYDTLCRLAAVLEVDLRQVLMEDEEPKP